MPNEEYKDRPRDYFLATLMWTDPERFAALRRATTGTTRCPSCDEVNRADQKRCGKCGAKLYYDTKDDEDELAEKDRLE